MVLLVEYRDMSNTIFGRHFAWQYIHWRCKLTKQIQDLYLPLVENVPDFGTWISSSNLNCFESFFQCAFQCRSVGFYSKYQNSTIVSMIEFHCLQCQLSSRK